MVWTWSLPGANRHALSSTVSLAAPRAVSAEKEALLTSSGQPVCSHMISCSRTRVDLVLEGEGGALTLAPTPGANVRMFKVMERERERERASVTGVLMFSWW